MHHTYQRVPSDEPSDPEAPMNRASQDKGSMLSRCFRVIRGPFAWAFEHILQIVGTSTAQKRIEDLKNRVQDLQNDNQILKKRNQQLQFDLEESRKENYQLNQQVSSLEYRVEKINKSYEQEKEEKEKALTRLSSVAGERLRFNNPAIADLSDENRPNKLAEKFSELYDNEWTEFYEKLEGLESTEEEKIGQIVQILQGTFNISSSLAKHQRKVLIQAITHPEYMESKDSESGSPPEGVMSKVIDLQKRTASLAFEDLKKKILEKYSHVAENSSAKIKFFERCSQLCWMMAIQDPPMHLDFGPDKDSVIDKNVFRLYTKSGENVDFVVWPAVFLHQNGPIVQKGVLQPK